MEQTKTIKTENGELYVQGDVIVGRMETEGNTTIWYKGDKFHREGDLPAYIRRNDAGAVMCEEYWRNGKWHRDGDLPAVIRRNDAGVVTVEEYHRDDKLHRDGDLPAVIDRNESGAVVREGYYRDGVKISSADIKTAKSAQELVAANEQIAKLTAEVEKLCSENTLMREKLQKIRALVE